MRRITNPTKTIERGRVRSARARGIASAGKALLLGGLAAASLARACIVCVPDALETVLVTELERSGAIVVATPADSRFRIKRVLRGPSTLTTGTLVDAALPMFSEERGKMGLGSVLLTRRDEKAAWVIRAPATDRHQQFFDDVLALPAADSTDVLDELNRAVFFVGHLHHQDPILARTGAAQVARLPYPALKNVRSLLDRERIHAELRKPTAVDRRALLFTLLGVCGTEEDAAYLDRLAESMWQRKNWKNLAAVLTAHMELGGAQAVDEVEERYFRDRGRTYAEIEQAILALRIHGDADDTITRERVIASFRTLFDDREPLVALILPDLIRWQDWESRERIVELAERRGAEFPDLERHANAYLTVHPGETSRRLPLEP